MKRDIKNIIKRIIVGVGIALVLGFLKTHNVFADTIPNNVVLTQFDNYLFPKDKGDYLELFSLKSPYNNFNYNYLSSSTTGKFYNKGYMVFYNETEDIYFYMFPRNPTYENIDIKKMKIISNNGNPEYQFYHTDTEEYSTSGGLVRSFILSNKKISDFSTIISNNSPSLVGQNNGNYFYRAEGNLLSDFLDNWTLIDSNMSYFDFYGDILIEDGIPSYYQKVDLTEYQAVYFVPKDYRNVPLTIYNNISYIDFKFYYKGLLKYGFFPVQNTDDLFIDNVVPYNSLNDISLVDTFFPLTEDGSESDGYQYYSAILFNQDSPSSIYYDSRYFNHYIIDSMEYYNGNIDFINKQGQDSGANIIFTDRWDDAFNSSFSQGGSEWGPQIGGNTIDSFFSKIKYPFDWLRSLLNRNSCSTINIPLPFVGGSIPIECMSSKLKSVLGDFYNILSTIINAFLLYKITLMNIDTITDVLDPDDGKLEVVDL